MLRGADFVAGHNILQHDWKYVGAALAAHGIDTSRVIDTLYPSSLLFPKRPYHALVKDDKLRSDDLNDPVSDAKRAQDLFYDEINAYERLDLPQRQVLYALLWNNPSFVVFFSK
ncbi:MAG: hypothetical protein OHK0039_33610 [Bacteroidia bacterium]